MLKTTDFTYVLFNQTSKNKVYFEKIIVGTTKVDYSSPTFPFPVQKDRPLVQDAYYKK